MTALHIISNNDELYVLIMLYPFDKMSIKRKFLFPLSCSFPKAKNIIFCNYLIVGSFDDASYWIDFLFQILFGFYFHLTNCTTFLIFQPSILIVIFLFHSRVVHYLKVTFLLNGFLKAIWDLARISYMSQFLYSFRIQAMIEVSGKKLLMLR